MKEKDENANGEAERKKIMRRQRKEEKRVRRRVEQRSARSSQPLKTNSTLSYP